MPESCFKFKTVGNIDTLKILNDLGNTTSSANDRLDALSLKHGAEILHGPDHACDKLLNKNVKIRLKMENRKAPAIAQGKRS